MILRDCGRGPPLFKYGLLAELLFIFTLGGSASYRNEQLVIRVGNGVVVNFDIPAFPAEEKRHVVGRPPFSKGLQAAVEKEKLVSREIKGLPTTDISEEDEHFTSSFGRQRLSQRPSLPVSPSETASFSEGLQGNGADFRRPSSMDFRGSTSPGVTASMLPSPSNKQRSLHSDAHAISSPDGQEMTFNELSSASSGAEVGLESMIPQLENSGVSSRVSGVTVYVPLSSSETSAPGTIGPGRTNTGNDTIDSNSSDEGDSNRLTPSPVNPKLSPTISQTDLSSEPGHTAVISDGKTSSGEEEEADSDSEPKKQAVEIIISGETPRPSSTSLPSSSINQEPAVSESNKPVSEGKLSVSGSSQGSGIVLNIGDGRVPTKSSEVSPIPSPTSSFSIQEPSTSTPISEETSSKESTPSPASGTGGGSGGIVILAEAGSLAESPTENEGDTSKPSSDLFIILAPFAQQGGEESSSPVVVVGQQGSDDTGPQSVVPLPFPFLSSSPTPQSESPVPSSTPSPSLSATPSASLSSVPSPSASPSASINSPTDGTAAGADDGDDDTSPEPSEAASDAASGTSGISGQKKDQSKAFAIAMGVVGGLLFLVLCVFLVGAVFRGRSAPSSPATSRHDQGPVGGEQSDSPGEMRITQDPVENDEEDTRGAPRRTQGMTVSASDFTGPSQGGGADVNAGIIPEPVLTSFEGHTDSVERTSQEERESGVAASWVDDETPREGVRVPASASRTFEENVTTHGGPQDLRGDRNSLMNAAGVAAGVSGAAVLGAGLANRRHSRKEESEEIAREDAEEELRATKEYPRPPEVAEIKDANHVITAVESDKNLNEELGEEFKGPDAYLEAPQLAEMDDTYPRNILPVGAAAGGVAGGATAGIASRIAALNPDLQENANKTSTAGTRIGPVSHGAGATLSSRASSQGSRGSNTAGAGNANQVPLELTGDEALFASADAVTFEPYVSHSRSRDSGRSDKSTSETGSDTFDIPAPVIMRSPNSRGRIVGERAVEVPGDESQVEVLPPLGQQVEPQPSTSIGSARSSSPPASLKDRDEKWKQYYCQGHTGETDEDISSKPWPEWWATRRQGMRSTAMSSLLSRESGVGSVNRSGENEETSVVDDDGKVGNTIRTMSSVPRSIEESREEEKRARERLEAQGVERAVHSPVLPWFWRREDVEKTHLHRKDVETGYKG